MCEESSLKISTRCHLGILDPHCHILTACKHLLIRVEVRGSGRANGCVIAFESHLDPLKGLFMWFARPPYAQSWVILSLEYCFLSYSCLIWKISYIVISTERSFFMRSTLPVMFKISFGHSEHRVGSGEISKIRSQVNS